MNIFRDLLSIGLIVLALWVSMTGFFFMFTNPLYWLFGIFSTIIMHAGLFVFGNKNKEGLIKGSHIYMINQSFLRIPCYILFFILTSNAFAYALSRTHEYSSHTGFGYFIFPLFLGFVSFAFLRKEK